MADIANFILDILAELGGGRGAPGNALAPHLLGMVLWAWPAFFEARHQLVSTQPKDLLLLCAFMICLLVELSLLSVDAMLIEGVVTQGYLQTFWPPLELFLVLASRVLVAGAFLHLLLRSWPVAVNYISICFVVAWTGYAVLAIAWLSAVAQDPVQAFGDSIVSLMLHWLGFAFMSVAIGYLLRSERRIRIPIITAFIFFALSELVALSGLIIGQRYAHIEDPIRGHLALWAIPFLSYAAIRIRQVNEKRYEQSVQNSARLQALGQLSSGIAHDFNNHLQVILGYVELARSNHTQPERLAVPLDRIEEAAQAAGTLVKQLLTFSTGHKTEFQAVDMNEVITGLTPMISRLLGPDLKLVHDLDINAPTVLADRRMMEQVIVNLIVNARDAMNNQGIIRVETHATSPTIESATTDHDHTQFGSVQLIISDTGIGMDKATLRRACEPFFTTKPVGQGTGLGLATVYGIVQQHGGTVTIESKPDQYTRVIVECPAADENSLDRVQAARPERTTRTLRGHETILLCEDDLAIRDFCVALLESAGYHVLVANDGQHAINIVNTYEGMIDLYLFDVIMPRLNGYQTYDRISARGVSVPALFITGSTSRAESLRTQHAHLQKPFNSETLLQHVRDVLDQPILSEQIA